MTPAVQSPRARGASVLWLDPRPRPLAEQVRSIPASSHTEHVLPPIPRLGMFRLGQGTALSSSRRQGCQLCAR